MDNPAPHTKFLTVAIRAGARNFTDETTPPTLAPGTGKTKIAWLWGYAHDDRSFGGTGPPIVAHRFKNGRGGDCPFQHLPGFARPAADRRI